MSSFYRNPYITLESQAELAVLMDTIRKIELFYDDDIQHVIDKHATQIKRDLEMEAPYDYQELDDYHMREHMTKRDYNGPLGDGKEVESEAPYSGHLEYGTAVHGVQHVFFRPVDERNKKAYKEEVLKIMKGFMR